MSGSAGQAAGLAVGAAVGSIFGPAGTLAGAAIGSAGGGLYDTWGNLNTQKKLDTAALKLNQAEFHNKAAAQGAIHAEQFRQALASQVALSTMRGGSGSLAIQFGQDAYRKFTEDQKAIEMGVKVADVQTQLGQADIDARTEAARSMAISRAAVSAFDGLNLNAPRTRK
jgi:hypothetical protein